MPERMSDAAASQEPASTDPQGPPPGFPEPPDPSKRSEPTGESDPQAETPEPDARLAGMPDYKGEPLDAERGPGLGCFWIQIALLTFFLVLTPLTVTWGWDPFISGALLILTLILLLFSGQTVIFLLRLVAADRRTRRTPLDPKAKPTVGQMEEAGSATVATSHEPVQGDEARPGGERTEGDEP